MSVTSGLHSLMRYSLVDNPLFFSGCFPDFFLSLGCRSLILICLVVHFLGFILFGVCLASSVSLCVLPVLGHFYPLFLWVLWVLFQSYSTFLPLFGTLMIQMLLVLLLESSRFLKLCSFVFSLFSWLLRLVKFYHTFLSFIDSVLYHLYYWAPLYFFFLFFF